jgi:hypothetical protein
MGQGLGYLLVLVAHRGYGDVGVHGPLGLSPQPLDPMAYNAKEPPAGADQAVSQDNGQGALWRRFAQTTDREFLRGLIGVGRDNLMQSMDSLIETVYASLPIVLTAKSVSLSVGSLCIGFPIHGGKRSSETIQRPSQAAPEISRPRLGKRAKYSDEFFEGD